MSSPVMYHQHMSFESMRRDFFFYDHFYGSGIQDLWTNTGNGSGTVIDGVAGGICRLVSGAAATNNHALTWGTKRSLFALNEVAMEGRLEEAETNDAEFYFRLLNAGHQSLFIWGSAGAELKIYTRNGAGTTQNDASNWTRDTNPHIYRIQCHLYGGLHVHYYQDNVQSVGSPHLTNVETHELEPHIMRYTAAAANKTMDIDYVAVRM